MDAARRAGGGAAERSRPGGVCNGRGNWERWQWRHEAEGPSITATRLGTGDWGSGTVGLNSDPEYSVLSTELGRRLRDALRGRGCISAGRRIEPPGSAGFIHSTIAP